MGEAIKPVRLRLSRAKGFNLQDHSLATNGLSAVNVARPSKWGNPFVLMNEEGWPLIEGPRYCSGVPDDDWDVAQEEVVRLFRERLRRRPPKPEQPSRQEPRLLVQARFVPRRCVA